MSSPTVPCDHPEPLTESGVGDAKWQFSPRTPSPSTSSSPPISPSCITLRHEGNEEEEEEEKTPERHILFPRSTQKLITKNGTMSFLQLDEDLEVLLDDDDDHELVRDIAVLATPTKRRRRRKRRKKSNRQQKGEEEREKEEKEEKEVNREQKQKQSSSPSPSIFSATSSPQQETKIHPLTLRFDSNNNTTEDEDDQIESEFVFSYFGPRLIPLQIVIFGGVAALGFSMISAVQTHANNSTLRLFELVCRAVQMVFLLEIEVVALVMSIWACCIVRASGMRKKKNEVVEGKKGRQQQQKLKWTDQEIWKRMQEQTSMICPFSPHTLLEFAICFGLGGMCLMQGIVSGYVLQGNGVKFLGIYLALALSVRVRAFPTLLIISIIGILSHIVSVVVLGVRTHWNVSEGSATIERIIAGIVLLLILFLPTLAASYAKELSVRRVFAARLKLDAFCRTLVQEGIKQKRLMHNILPSALVGVMAMRSRFIRHFALLAVVVNDIAGFTAFCSSKFVDSGLVFRFLNRVFTTWDSIALRNGLEKVKTVGDSFVGIVLRFSKGDSGSPFHDTRVALRSAVQMNQAFLIIKKRMRVKLSDDGCAEAERISSSSSSASTNSSIIASEALSLLGLRSGVSVGHATVFVIAGTNRANPSSSTRGFTFDVVGEAMTRADQLQVMAEVGEIFCCDRVVRMMKKKEFPPSQSSSSLPDDGSSDPSSSSCSSPFVRVRSPMKTGFPAFVLARREEKEWFRAVSSEDELGPIRSAADGEEGNEEDGVWCRKIREEDTETDSDTGEKGQRTRTRQCFQFLKRSVFGIARRVFLLRNTFKATGDDLAHSHFSQSWLVRWCFLIVTLYSVYLFVLNLMTYPSAIHPVYYVHAVSGVLCGLICLVCMVGILLSDRWSGLAIQFVVWGLWNGYSLGFALPAVVYGFDEHELVLESMCLSACVSMLFPAVPFAVKLSSCVWVIALFAPKFGDANWKPISIVAVLATFFSTLGVGFWHESLMQAYDKKAEQRKQARRLIFERAQTEALLLSALPAPILRSIVMGGGRDMNEFAYEDFDQAGVLFCHVGGLPEGDMLVICLEQLYSTFDLLVGSVAEGFSSVAKVKSTRCKYICIAWGHGAINRKRRSPTIGKNTTTTTPATAMTSTSPCLKQLGRFSQRMLEIAAEAKEELSLDDLHLCIGISIGSLCGGLIGKTRWCWDIFGDTVNVAARLAQTCNPGQAHCIEEFADLLWDGGGDGYGDFVSWESDKVALKGKGNTATCRVTFCEE